LANKDRIIVAQHVEPTSEQAAVAPMLDQADRVAGDVETLLTPPPGSVESSNKSKLKQSDSKGHADQPEGVTQRAGADARSGTARITKQDFIYDKKNDHYICPNGQVLKPGSLRTDRRRGTPYKEYSATSKACQGCDLLSRCVRGKTQRRRRVRRYHTDELMEALRVVMEQPRAQAQLVKRRSWVEPVFSDLKGIQGLTRFRRFGLRGVRLEFAIHACAHNLRRLVAVLATLCALLFAFLRGHISHWQVPGGLDTRSRSRVRFPVDGLTAASRQHHTPQPRRPVLKTTASGRPRSRSVRFGGPQDGEPPGRTRGPGWRAGARLSQKSACADR
jgi:hypothetical protein